MDSYDTFNQEVQKNFKIYFKTEHMDYQSPIHNQYTPEKSLTISEDEKPKAFENFQKSSKGLNEFFNKNNNYRNNQLFKTEENNIDNFNSKEQLQYGNNLEYNISDKDNENDNENDNNDSIDFIENNTNSNAKVFRSGRWSDAEHKKFIEGILKYGNEWKKVQNIIKTRSSTQARSHAQKFFLRLKGLNQDTLSNQDKLFNFIINSGDASMNKIKFSPEQKEKLMSVVKSNLKLLNKSNKELLTAEDKNNSLNDKNESGLYDYNDEEDNLAYNKQNEFEEFVLQKKMSCDIEEKNRKNTFCSRKRKSSGDLTLNSSFNKIFNITKDVSHKNSIDNNKNNNIVSNNSQLKESKENTNYFCPKKIRVNNQNFIINKVTKNISNTNNNKYQENKDLNEQLNLVNTPVQGKIIINNNFISIFNINGNDHCINQNPFINNNKKPNNYQNNNSYSRTVIFHPDRKTTTKTQIKNNKNNTIEKGPNKNEDVPYIINNHNFFPPFQSQEINNIKNENVQNEPNEQNEQNDPFDLVFESYSTNNNKQPRISINDSNQIKFNDRFQTMSEKTNNNGYNDD